MKTATIKKLLLEKLYLGKKKSTKQIAKELNLGSKGVVSYWLQKYGIPTRKTGGGQNFKDISNQRFGRLISKYRVFEEKKYSCARWFCECDCGKSTVVASVSLRKGLTISCGCFRTEKMFKGYGDLSKSYWNRIVKGAKSRNLKLSVNINDAWNQFENQKRKCALTGLPITIVRDYTRHHNENTASLDRIDNNLGYIEGNIQWVHRDINIMRNNYDINYFIEICNKVSEYARKFKQ